MLTHAVVMIDIRRKIREQIALSDRTTLEIGALDKPIADSSILSNSGKIFYLDHLSTDELQSKYANDSAIDIKKIVPVDFVCSGDDFLQAVGGKKFGTIVASHVFEHVPNPLKWVRDVLSVLEDDGVLHLIIPDKRFSFDRLRPLTTFGDMFEAYIQDRKVPSARSVYDHFSAAVSTNTGAIWHGLLDDVEVIPLGGEKLAIENARAAGSENIYYDVHVSVLTPHSFLDILRIARDSGLVEYEIVEFIDTQIGELEFFVSIKNEGPNNSKRSKVGDLDIVPRLSTAQVLSPYMPQVKRLSSTIEKLTDTQRDLLSEINRLRHVLEEKETFLKNIHEQLHEAQLVATRRSVKLMLSLVDILCRILPFLKKK